MGQNEAYGNVFGVAQTATTTEAKIRWDTDAAATGGEAYDVFTYKQTIVNEGGVNLLYRLDGPSGYQHTLEPGETIAHVVRSPAIWIEAASGTVAMQAWGEG